MRSEQITSFRDRIRATETFKGLGDVAKKITLARNNTAYIHHGYTVAKNIGYKKWEKQSNYNYRNREIIKEILSHEQD